MEEEPALQSLQVLHLFGSDAEELRLVEKGGDGVSLPEIDSAGKVGVQVSE